MVGSSWFKTFFSSRCIRNRAQTPSEALSKLQSEGETSPLLGGQGDGASGDDPLPARQLGKYRGGTAESFLTFMLMCLHGFTDQPFLPACSRTRRTRRWRPTCSWIWYDLCNIRLHHPTPHHCSDSQRWPSPPPPPAPTLTAAFPPPPLLCSQMDLSLPITQKPTRCFIYRLLRLVRSCPSLAPAN